jgi:hypothetical protein
MKNSLEKCSKLENEFLGKAAIAIIVILFACIFWLEYIHSKILCNSDLHNVISKWKLDQTYIFNA